MLRFTIANHPVPPLAPEQRKRARTLATRYRIAHRATHALTCHCALPGAGLFSRMFARSLLPKLGAPVSCRTCMGFELVVSAADGPHYYYDGCYEAGTLHVMSRCLRRGDTFVDVGASIGQMTMHAASLVGAHGRVLSFEPPGASSRPHAGSGAQSLLADRRVQDRAAKTRACVLCTQIE